MSSAKEIRDRINGIGETKKITTAMYLIASTKMRRVRQGLERTRPYFDALRAEVRRMFRHADETSSAFFINDEEVIPSPVGIMVITADKGLAGGYNVNAIKAAEQLLARYPDSKLYVVGEFGRHYFTQHGVPFENSFCYSADDPTVHKSRNICSVLLGDLKSQVTRSLYIVYTDIRSGGESVKTRRLVPFRRSALKANEDPEADAVDFEYMPGVYAILENVVLSYLTGFIYSALVDSYCSELTARMEAMNAANDNADEMLQELRLNYQRARQGAITAEITEISSGARHKRSKK